MKKIVIIIILALMISGCSHSETFSFDVGSKELKDVIDVDIYGGIIGDMKVSEIVESLGKYNNFFQDKEYNRKIYEWNLDKGILQAVVEPSDDSMYTSYIFKPFLMYIEDIFKVDVGHVDEGVKWIYVNKYNKNKALILLEGKRINEIIIY